MGVDAEMFVRHKGRLSEVNVRRLAAEMCKRFGHDRFMTDRVGEYGKPHHALTIISSREWDQDGPTIEAKLDEEFIRVHFFGRYYGPGYERGDWPLIRGVAEFLESRIPGGEVWYGGDSGGMCAEKLDAIAREEMNSYFLAHGHEPYRNYKGPSSFRRKAPLCDFCGGIEMHDVGGGGDREFWSCDGCGLKRIITPRGAYDLKDKQDFFGFVESACESST